MEECDVSSHFQEMIYFGNYDSILPEEAKLGLQEDTVKSDMWKTNPQLRGNLRDFFIHLLLRGQ